MPYPNEHACRLKSPGRRGDYEWARVERTSKSVGKKYAVIRRTKTGEDDWEDQAYRYPKDDWTVAEARSHCSSHDGMTFESASPDVEVRFGQLEAVTTMRRETLDEREHLVVPAVMLTTGVHTGLAGIAVHYPQDEIEAVGADWNGIPVTIGHPMENGKPVSARTPKAVSAHVVGRVFNSDSSGGKARGEIWLDVVKTEKSRPGLLNMIRSGTKVEVSTGIFYDLEEATGTWNEEEYAVIARSIRPDHLAILPGQVGACSWEDGCGLRANVTSEEANMPDGNIRNTARTPSFDGTETIPWAGVKTSFEVYRDAYYESHGEKPKEEEVVKRVADAPAAMRKWIASKTLLGDGETDAESDLIFFPVVNPNTGKLNEGALRAVIGGHGAQAKIDAAAKKSAQDKARSLLNEHFDAELKTRGGLKRLIAGALRSWLSGQGECDDSLEEMSFDAIREAVAAKLQEPLPDTQRVWIPELYEDSVVYEVDSYGASVGNAPTGLFTRAYVIDEEGTVTLGDKVTEVKREVRYVPIVSAQGGSSGSGQEMEKEQDMEKKAQVDILIACERTRWAEDDRDWLMSLDAARLEKMRAVEQTPPADNQAAPPLTVPPVPEVHKPPTFDDLLKSAAPEIRGMIERGLAREKGERIALVGALKSNPNNPFTDEWLNARTTEELADLVAFGGSDADYSVRSGGPAPQGASPTPIPQVWDLSGGKAASA